MDTTSTAKFFDAYANDFLFMFWITLIVFPVIWMIRRPAYSMSGSGGSK